MHWATAALLAGSYTTAWLVSSATSSAGVSRLLLLHRSAGLTILTLTAIRLCWRQATTVPDLPADVPPLQRLAARANVVGLYLLLFLQPLLGLTASMLHGDRVLLLGGIVLPDPLPVSRGMAHSVFVVHGVVAWLLLGLIGMHVAAALYHHLIRRDGVLAGMLPGLRPRPAPAPLPAPTRR